MKAFAIAALAAIASAVSVETTNEQWDGEYYQYPQEEYFSYPQYSEPNYEYGMDPEAVMPGPDFNKSCYDFNTCHMIFSEEDYEHRVMVEAELMVSLEALKESIMVLNLELAGAEQQIMDNNMSIRINQRMIYRNMDMILTVVPISQSRVGQLQGRARDAQAALDGDLGALVLYCQQFAWAPEMVGACRDVLTCNGRELPYRTQFPVIEGAPPMNYHEAGPPQMDMHQS